MGIAERRARERQQRERAILESAWEVAEEVGWARFSVEQVAAKAELGRATVYGYFAALDRLGAGMATEAFAQRSVKLAEDPRLPEGPQGPGHLPERNRP